MTIYGPEIMYSKQIFEKHAALLRSLFSGIQKNLMAAA
jgi:hypothetical protein